MSNFIIITNFLFEIENDFSGEFKTNNLKINHYESGFNLLFCQKFFIITKSIGKVVIYIFSLLPFPSNENIIFVSYIIIFPTKKET